MESVVEETPAGEMSEGAGRPEERTHFLAVLLCFVLSGFAALLYQTAWLRQFSIVFGTSELAVAMVLAAYMAGLAFGAGIGGKLVDRVKRPVLTYGILEIGIAIGALLVPLGLKAARGLQTTMIGGQADLTDAGGTGQSIFFLGAAFLIIMIPTTFMGATLPLLTRHAVRRDSQIGTRVGLLYTMNTAGAVAGTWVAAFHLLPTVGLATTVYIGVAVNALVFFIAAGIAKGSQEIGESEGAASSPEKTEPEEADASWRGSIILPLVLISGITSFTYEVLWTRLLSQILGGSITAFATMLASFLIGITLGSAIASAFARTRKGSAIGFVVSQLGIAWLSMFVWSQLDGLPERFLALREASDGTGLTAQASVAVFVLLPAALCIGATFPFALRVLSNRSQAAGRDSARVYSWNTVGGIIGAVLAGFLLIPELSFTGATRLAVMTNLALAVITALVYLRSSKLIVGLTLGCLLLGIGGFQPESPEKLLRYSSFGLPADGRIVHKAVGRSATVLAIEQEGFFEIRSNGLPEALITPRGAPPFGQNSPYHLALLPVLARPLAKEMLVIGFGGGVTLEAIPPSVRSVTSIELEPEIIAANQAISELRAIDPLKDPRLTVVHNDARGALAVTDKRWDIIVSQPSHPWTAGASHLYTREFLGTIKEHLQDDGVFVQWMNAGFLDEQLFGTVGNTLMDAFTNVRLYRPIPHMLIFLASDGPLDVERQIVKTGLPMRANPGWWARRGFFDVNDAAAMLTLDMEGLKGLCKDAPLNTDDENILAMRADPDKVNFRNNSVDEFILPWDPVLRSKSAFSTEFEEHLDRPYLASKWANSDLLLRAIESTKLMEEGSADQLRTLGSLRASVIFGQWADGNAAFAQALKLDRYNVDVKFLALRDNLPIIARHTEGREAESQLASELEGTAAMVFLGWEHAVNERWDALSLLDTDLRMATPRDPWFIEACRLRAEWRLKMEGDPQTKQVRAREAVRVIDLGLIWEPFPFLLTQRAHAGLAARQPHVVLETLSSLCDFVGPRASSLPINTVHYLAEELGRFKGVVDLLHGNQEVPEWRVIEVEEKMKRVHEEHLARLAKLREEHSAANDPEQE